VIHEDGSRNFDCRRLLAPQDESNDVVTRAKLKQAVEQLFKDKAEMAMLHFSGRRAEAERRIRAYMKLGSENGGQVIVVPFRIAGFGPYKEVLEGFEYLADEKDFCPHPGMTRWIEETAHECFAGLSTRP